MIKRMTLLAKKEGMATSDFRAHWAGPHAQLALCMEGITEYHQNRVDKLLWVNGGGDPPFNADGIVELCFASTEAMRAAQTSAIGQQWIPADELLFLKGWTLCVVDSVGDASGDAVGDAPNAPRVKVLVPFHGVKITREALWSAIHTVNEGTGISTSLNWTVSTASRQRLWSEPQPPQGIACFWFNNLADAYQAFEPASLLRGLLEMHTHNAVAYLVNHLRLK